MSKRLLLTVFISAVIFSYFLWQFPSDRRFTIFFINKTAAETAVILIGLSYLLGPICRIIPWFARHLAYRRYFGVAGFAFVIAHIIFSLMQLSDRFPFSWYVEHVWGVVAAVVATAIFSVLAATSTNHAVSHIGSKKWKTIQRIGYVAVLFTAVHIAVASWDRWVMWRAGEVAMPDSFVVFAVAVVVILARILAFFADKLFPRFPSK